MAINIIDGFYVGAPYPIDNRITATDSSVKESILYKYDGLKVFQLDDRKSYTWNESTATWSDDSSGVITSSGGTLNYIPRFNSSYVLSNSILFTDNTNGYLLINPDSSITSANTPRSPLQINEKSSSTPPISILLKGNGGSSKASISYNWYYDSGDGVFENTKSSTLLYLNGGTSPNDGFEFLHRIASSGVGAFTTIGKIYYNNTISNYQSHWPSGASSSPGICFIDQSGSGLFYTSPDMGISLAGVQVLRISNTNKYVGIGTHQPQSKLHLDSGNAVASYLKFTAGTTTGVSSSDGFDVGINSSGVPIFNSGDSNQIKVQFGGTDYVNFGTSSAITFDMFGSGLDFIKESYSYDSFLSGGGLGVPTTRSLTHSFSGTSNDEVIYVEATVVTYIKGFGSSNYGGTHKIAGSFKKVGSTTYTQIGSSTNIFSVSDATGDSIIATPSFATSSANILKVSQSNTIEASGDICESWCHFKVIQVDASSFA